MYLSLNVKSINKLLARSLATRPSQHKYNVSKEIFTNKLKHKNISKILPDPLLEVLEIHID